MGKATEMVRVGDVKALRTWLQTQPDPAAVVDVLGKDGETALYYAVCLPHPPEGLVETLLEAGADPAFRLGPRFNPYNAYQSDQLLRIGALKAGNPETVRTLQRYGADFGFRDGHNYTAMIRAVYEGGDERLPLIECLIDLGVEVHAVTTYGYGESAVGVASEKGHFKIVSKLLEAGADEAVLEWTPLHRATAIGTANELIRALEEPVDLEAYDSFGRTALHTALLKGEDDRVDLLRAAGAKLDQLAKEGVSDPRLESVSGLGFVVKGGHHALLARLLAEDPAGKDSALEVAVDKGDLQAAEMLLIAGANPNQGTEFDTLLDRAEENSMVQLLVKHRAWLSDLDSKSRRKLLGMREPTFDHIEGVTQEEYLTYRYPREGQANPEQMSDPFRLAMIRAGSWPMDARRTFDDPVPFVWPMDEAPRNPVWCFDRFGQSTTILPDGRFVFIGGEYDDWYDPDYFIYNDVIVYRSEDDIQIYGYPFSVFPPTDFHSATLVGEWMYILGALGNMGERGGELRAYRLNTIDFHFEFINTIGERPGWIYKHRATLSSDGRKIRIDGGKRLAIVEGEEKSLSNDEIFELDLLTSMWSKIPSGTQ